MEEIWKPVSYASFCEIYEISNFGRLRRKFVGGYRKVSTEYVEAQDRMKALLHYEKRVKTLNVGIEVAKVFGVEIKGNKLCYKDGDSRNLCVENLYFIRTKKKNRKVAPHVPKVFCQDCKRYPTNYEACNVMPCNITGILKFKTNFADCGCKHFDPIQTDLNLVK